MFGLAARGRVSMIHIRSLSKTFAGPNGGTIAALGPLDLAIADGEFVCVVGPSGCGKSTLLRLIAGLEAPTSGISEVTPAPEVTPSLVFQGDSTFPWMTVNENVGYGLRIRGEPDRQRDSAVAKMLALVGLTPFAEAYPYQLSGGMKQRVAIARALATDANTLLMDEPFGALDEQNRILLQNELLRIWEGDPGGERKTVLFVTHSIDEALILGDRVLVMGAAPGLIKAEIRVPFARPREVYALKRDPAFGALGASIWDILKSEVRR